MIWKFQLNSGSINAKIVRTHRLLTRNFLKYPFRIREGNSHKESSPCSAAHSKDFDKLGSGTSVMRSLNAQQTRSSAWGSRGQGRRGEFFRQYWTTHYVKRMNAFRVKDRIKHKDDASGGGNYNVSFLRTLCLYKHRLSEWWCWWWW